METYYLAIDIGASSGRHILGHMEGDRMCLEEVYRFPNGMKEKNGHLCWDVEKLFHYILEGMKECSRIGKIPKTMGIDTWAVDFVLLDEKDQMLGDAVGYRDSRTTGMERLVYETIPEKELYARTGIQKQIFNTIYQLEAVKTLQPEQFARAKTFLMIPDYLHFLLTGVKKQEYTNATTTQLVSPETKTWDTDLMDSLGFPKEIFLPVEQPGTVVGWLKEEITEAVGFSAEVVLPATHDTGSAVLAVPSKEDHPLYISSGTWSLMGTEEKEADCTERSRLHNLTNEGGYAYRFRYLKNIMGLWMIQNVRTELKKDYSYADLCRLAAKSTIPSRVDCNDDCFLAPASMISAVQEFCRNTKQPVPETAEDLAAVIYHSLAECYGKTLRELEEMTGTAFSSIHVVGGGANASFLNHLTAKATGCTVYAGPIEATAIGNLMVQMIRDGVWPDLATARNAVFQSFPIKEYRP